jgi:hypothetical protein
MIRKLVALLIVPLVLAMTACSGAATKVTPADLNGAWASADANGTTFEAAISDNLIEINLASSGTKALYWKGTLPLGSDSTADFTVTSAADTDALSGSILGSQDPTKTFTYSAGKLKFDFSAMGVTKTVELSKR